MPSYVCSVRIRLPRPLFRKLMARAILERTELSALIERAVRSDLAGVVRGPCRALRPASRKAPEG
ncbi:MAG: hypothetical protein ABSF76_09445 [Opitutaceae bacterium]|jgi:hypothetical protein